MNWNWKQMQTPEQKLKLLNKTIETIWHGVSDTKECNYQNEKDTGSIHLPVNWELVKLVLSNQNINLTDNSEFSDIFIEYIPTIANNELVIKIKCIPIDLTMVHSCIHSKS